MPDIFGREAEDYQVIRAMQEVNSWERYQAEHALLHRSAEPVHSFQALGAGVPQEFHRATEDQQAVGYLTNNLLAIQTAIDEVLYTAYRLPQFISMNTNIDSGARSYGVRISDRVGRAQRVSGPGYEAPAASTSITLVDHPIFWYGADGFWALDELRGAIFSGVPLDTLTVENAVTGTLEKMEEVGLLGEEGEPGLLTLPSSGDKAPTVMDVSSAFEDMTPVEIREVINTRLSSIIDRTAETFGRNITAGMTIYLPGKQYDLLNSLYIGDNAQRLLMQSIMDENPWTAFSGAPIAIERVLELDATRRAPFEPTPSTGSGDRMVIGLRNSRVCEMGVSISPRVLRIMDQGRVYKAQIEAKFSTLFVKRADTIIYTNGI